MAHIKRRVRQAGAYFVTAKTAQGKRLFQRHGNAKIVMEQIIQSRDRGFYALHAFVVMPDHFHALLTPSGDTTIEKALQMIKGGASYKLRREAGSKITVWQEGYHDRWIRSREEFNSTKRYIEQNPVRAGLVQNANEYKFSSANNMAELDPSRYDEQTQPVRG